MLYFKHKSYKNNRTKRKKMKKGKHEHICENCKEHFYGRLNRKFCPDKPCKTEFNNDKNKRVNIELKAETDIIKNCRKILKAKFQKHRHRPFPIAELFNAGFDKNVPTTKVKRDQDKKEWIKICEYCLSINSETKEVNIIKIK